jgi:catechol 2,3-dioxygenase-like lactoylglutathione lyase family enzyme
MISGLNHVTLAVTDVDQSFRFYKDLMGFRPLCKWPLGAYFLVGETWFCLSRDANRKPAIDYTHVAFTVSQADFERTVRCLLASGVTAFKENASEGDSFYFFDPDGHKLEIHVGDWQSRIAAKKKNPWPGAEFFW